MRKFVYILAALPLSVLYFIGDVFVYPLAYYVIRYRRKVVRKNLNQSFPNYSRKQIRLLERKFYHNFTNIIAEIVYGYRATDEDMRNRVKITNYEQVIDLINAQGGAFISLGHLGNWEWAAEIGKYVQTADIQQFNIYKKLRSVSFDDLMKDIRSKRTGFCCEKDNILRVLISQRQNNQKTCFGMVADQKPLKRNIHYWSTFLNQDTPFFSGVEKLARRFDYPVFYFHITCPKRGYYNMDLQLIAQHPAELPEFAVTEKYARLLEDNILLQPELWLWSHNRWKHGPRPIAVDNSSTQTTERNK